MKVIGVEGMGVVEGTHVLVPSLAQPWVSGTGREFLQVEGLSLRD